MRLLHAKNFTYKDFVGGSVPDYAIISHRWGDDEPSHQDFLKYKESDQIGSHQVRGWKKIRQAAWWALHCNIEWLWMDTICINKESSAELTEAINSMYTWYGAAKVCFVMLPDVHSLKSYTCGRSDSRTFYARDERLKYRHYDKPYFDKISAFSRTPQPFYEEEFIESCWFGRSWTLQELLAPEHLVFLNSDSQDIGTGFDLSALIRRATGIPTKYFAYRWYAQRPLVSSACVAERMRWASGRTATKVEDEAYCLLGLFNVNMPLLYGEGQRAFRRLQIEIIKDSTDESIFVWRNMRNDATTTVLAETPRHFSHDDVHQGFWAFRKHYDYTNLGICFKVPICRAQRRNTASTKTDSQRHLGDNATLLFPLDCERGYQTESGDITSGPVALLLRMISMEPYLKCLRAFRGSDELCIFKQNAPGETNDDDDVIPAPRGRPSVPLLYGKWLTMERGERAVFKSMVGRDSTGVSDEYSLYIHT